VLRDLRRELYLIAESADQGGASLPLKVVVAHIQAAQVGQVAHSLIDKAS
jgi:hypothetical protein